MTAKSFLVALAFVSVAALALVAAPAPAEAAWCAYACSCSSACSTVCQVATTDPVPGCRTREECNYQIVDTTCGAYGTCSGSASCSSAAAEAPDVLELLFGEDVSNADRCATAQPTAAL